MQLTLPQLDFTVSLNACYDEVMNKMQVLTNMEIQLLRKFQHQLSNSQMHYQMIHDVRVMIVNLQQVYKDVKEYFNEMGIQFVYDFFRKIQVLMVCGYNFLSQALLASVDKYQDKKNKQAVKQNYLNCKVCKCTCPQSIKNKKRQIRQVQQYDFKISILQNQQQKLASQIQSIYQKMMMQKSMIQKTKPSLAIRQLEDMKEHIQNVMQSTNSIFEQTYMMKYVEFKNYLTQIKKPQDLADYFISNMNFNMRDKFLKAMQKAIYKAQHMEQKLEKKHVKDVQIQTERVKQTTNSMIHNGGDSLGYRGFSSLKPQKNQNLLTKQRKHNQKIVTQIQFLRKQLNSLMAQNQRMKKQVQTKQAERLQFKQDYDTLQSLYSKRTFQLQNVQNQNKWLSTQKQTQTKKLKLQIKQLKKQRVEMISEQTQTFIPPNYVSKAVQTQVIYFQNQIDNEIINVLKKNNDKMILKLNQKQRKIRELKVGKEEIQKFRECKIYCMGFIEDLREVVMYKIRENNKESEVNNKSKGKKQELVSNRQPIVPLNQNTSNQSIVNVINKLTEDIKTILFTQNPMTNKRIHTTEQQRRSSTFKNKTFNSSFKNQDRKSQKSQESNKQVEGFFKNTKRNSVISLQKQIQSATNKQSIYKLEHDEKSSCSSRSSNVSYLRKSLKRVVQTIKQDLSQQKIVKKQNLIQKSSRSSSQKKSDISNSDVNRIRSQRRKSTFKIENQNKNSQKRLNLQDIVKQNTGRRGSKFQIKPLNQNIKVIRQQRQKQDVKKKKISTETYEQQTDLGYEDIKNLEQYYIDCQNNHIDLLKNISSSNKIRKQSYQSYMSKKHPYIRKPIMGRLNTGGRESDRNYVSVNSTLPMNDTEISQLIQEHINSSKDEFLPNKLNNITNYNIYKNLSYDNLHPVGGRQSNITLESRLSTLINPKSNRVSSNSGLIVFKKSNQNYQKRSSQMLFDGLGLQKNTSKENQKRNHSLNMYKNDSLLLGNPKKDSTFKNSGNKMDQLSFIDFHKQNIHPSRQAIPMKSIFVEKIIEQDENGGTISRTMSNHQPLIQVTKKTQVQRQRMSPQRISRQAPQTVFTRTVKQMILTTQTKQSLVQKIQQIYSLMQKQKQKKKLRKIIKNTYTPRNSNQRKSDKKKEMNNLSMRLGDILY